MMRRHSFLLLAALACACAIPVVAAEKPKISTVAPAGDLTAEVTAKIEVLQGALADNDSYSKAKMKVIPQNAGVLAVLAQAGWLLVISRKPVASLAAAPLMVLTHVLYGLGFWRGLFTPVGARHPRPPTPVVLERIAK